MLGIRLVLVVLCTWLAIAPVVAIVVGRALKAADPYADFELTGRIRQPASNTSRQRQVVSNGRLPRPTGRPAILR